MINIGAMKPVRKVTTPILIAVSESALGASSVASYIFKAIHNGRYIQRGADWVIEELRCDLFRSLKHIHSCSVHHSVSLITERHN